MSPPPDRIFTLHWAQVPPPPQADTDQFTPEPPPSFQFDDGVRIATLNAEFLFDGLGDEGQAVVEHGEQRGSVHRDRRGSRRVADSSRFSDSSA